MIHWRGLEWRAKKCYRRVDCATLSVGHPKLRQPVALPSGEREERLRRIHKSEWWLLFLWGQCLSEYSSHPTRPSEETRFSSLFSGAPLLVPSLRISEKNWSQWVRVCSWYTLVEEERPWWDSWRRRGSCLSLPSPLLLSTSLSQWIAASSQKRSTHWNIPSRIAALRWIRASLRRDSLLYQERTASLSVTLERWVRGTSKWTP